MKQLYLFSYIFGNFNSCVLIMSYNNIFEPSYPFYHKIGRRPFWIGLNDSSFIPKQSNNGLLVKFAIGYSAL